MAAHVRDGARMEELWECIGVSVCVCVCLKDDVFGRKINEEAGSKEDERRK